MVDGLYKGKASKGNVWIRLWTALAARMHGEISHGKVKDHPKEADADTPYSFQYLGLRGSRPFILKGLAARSSRVPSE